MGGEGGARGVEAVELSIIHDPAPVDFGNDIPRFDPGAVGGSVRDDHAGDEVGDVPGEGRLARVVDGFVGPGFDALGGRGGAAQLELDADAFVLSFAGVEVCAEAFGVHVDATGITEREDHTAHRPGGEFLLTLDGFDVLLLEKVRHLGVELAEGDLSALVVPARDETRDGIRLGRALEGLGSQSKPESSQEGQGSERARAGEEESLFRLAFRHRYGGIPLLPYAIVAAILSKAGRFRREVRGKGTVW